MTSAQIILLLLYILGGSLLGLLVWGAWCFWQPQASNVLPDVDDRLLFWLSVLAACALGVFLLFIFSSFGS